MGRDVRLAIKAEFLSLVLSSCLLHCNLGAPVCPQLVCTDASERGGSVDYATDLSSIGRDFTQAVDKLECTRGQTVIPVLLISLFNGIGGAFRCYDILGLTPQGRIAVDIDDAANRVTMRRWPGTLLFKDVRAITRATVRDWSMKFLGITEVHLWAGWPCVDLSAVKYGRQNLLGEQSSLFWEVPRIKNLVEEEFGQQVVVRHVLENVASMDESAAREISAFLECMPYLLDCVHAVPMHLDLGLPGPAKRLRAVFLMLKFGRSDIGGKCMPLLNILPPTNG